uniref:Uncharacterized protein n=1 Tax=Anopheles atroparvus TaxID=41427 RepID=A0AAG5CW19_ANOAO
RCARRSVCHRCASCAQYCPVLTCVLQRFNATRVSGSKFNGKCVFMSDIDVNVRSH